MKRLLCRLGIHTMSYEPRLLWGSWVTKHCIKCARVFEREAIYLPPPVKMVFNERELVELNQDERHMPCLGVHFNPDNQVDFIVIDKR